MRRQQPGAASGGIALADDRMRRGAPRRRARAASDRRRRARRTRRDASPISAARGPASIASRPAGWRRSSARPRPPAPRPRRSQGKARAQTEHARTLNARVDAFRVADAAVLAHRRFEFFAGGEPVVLGARQRVHGVRALLGELRAPWRDRARTARRPRARRRCARSRRSAARRSFPHRRSGAAAAQARRAAAPRRGGRRRGWRAFGRCVAAPCRRARSASTCRR